MRRDVWRTCIWRIELLRVRRTWIARRTVGRRSVKLLRLDRKEGARPAALAIIRRGGRCGGGVVERRLRCGPDVGEIGAGFLRHLEIRCVVLRNRCLDGIRERVVGPIPGAVIGRDGAIHRIALEAWRGLAALTELR